MIVVNTSDSKVFECAYFIMRNEFKPSKDESSLVNEANKIISAADSNKKNRQAKKTKGRGFVKFLLLTSIIAVSMILGRLSHFLF